MIAMPNTRQPSEVECPRCDAAAVETHIVPYTFEFRQGSNTVELSTEVPSHSCRDCGFEYLDDEAERRRHEAVCHHLGLLTPAEIRDIRRKYDLCRSAFAELTGLGESTIGRWESGAIFQSVANDRYLRLLRDPRNMECLEAIIIAARSRETRKEIRGSKGD